jgi:hypothetical protein
VTNESAPQSVTQGGGTITIAAAVPVENEVLINFSFDVADSKTLLFSIGTPTSSGAGKNRTLTGAETGPTTNAFTSKVALFSSSDLAKIESETGDLTNDLVANGGDADGIVQVDELNNLSPTAGLGTELNTRVQTASTTGLGLTASTTKASDFVLRSIPVSNGETLTLTYVDANPAATKTATATIDLAAPTVTLVQPLARYTSSATVIMEAQVVDTGAGVDSGELTLVQPAGVAGTAFKPPITNGFAASFSPSTSLAEGEKTWFIAVKDKVGNTPARDDTGTSTVNEGALGAAPFGESTADNPFKFNVDSSGPTLDSAHTGYYLKFPGVTATGSGQEAQAGDNRSWVRAVFGLGTGLAPLEPTSVAAADFKVASVTPLSVLVNTVIQDGNAVGTTVYLEVAEQATDARPKVEVVGEILDKAGNARTSGTVTNAVDKLSPVLTAVPAPSYAEKTVTTTITSSEVLSSNPTVITRTTAPTCADTTGTTATVTAVSSTSWTSVFTNSTGGTSKQWVVVTGTDSSTSANASILGDACVATVATSTDVVTFQVDDGNPLKKFPGTADAVTSTGTATAGAVWIIVRYDDDEYTGDTNRAVTVTAATLQKGTETAVDVLSQVFVGSTTVDESGTALSETHATVTLPRTLDVATYTYVITVKDAALNAFTLTHTLTVSAKPKFDIVLNPGVNLISIPGDVVGDGANINIAFTGLPVTFITTYDATLNKAGKNPWLSSTKNATTGLFTGDIAVLTPGKAYFVTADARATLKLDIASVGSALPPIVQVLQGFGAVGFQSIEGTLSGATKADPDAYLGSTKWSVAYSFDPTPGIGWQVIRPDGNLTDDLDGGAGDQPLNAGRGYLVYFTADGTLTP